MAIPRIISSSQTDTGPAKQPFLTLSLPAGIQAGQLLLATVAMQGSSTVVNPWGIIILPSGGWTEIVPGAPGLAVSGGLAMSISWKIASSTDTQFTPYTWGFTSNNFMTPVFGTGSIINIANINTTNPIEQINSLAASGTKVTAQPMNTLHNNSMNVLVYGITGDNYLSKPAGYSQIFQHQVYGVGPDMSVCTKVIITSGTNTGFQISTADTIGDNMGLQISLIPA